MFIIKANRSGNLYFKVGEGVRLNVRAKLGLKEKPSLKLCPVPFYRQLWKALRDAGAIAGQGGPTGTKGH